MYENGIEKSDPRIIKSLENLHQNWQSTIHEKCIIFYGAPSPWRNKLNDIILKIRAISENILIAHIYTNWTYSIQHRGPPSICPHRSRK